MPPFDADEDDGFVMDDALLDRWLSAMKVGPNDITHDFYVDAICSFEVTETELESLHEDGYEGILKQLTEDKFRWHKRVNKNHAKTIFRGLEKLLGLTANAGGGQM